MFIFNKKSRIIKKLREDKSILEAKIKQLQESNNNYQRQIDQYIADEAALKAAKEEAEQLVADALKEKKKYIEHRASLTARFNKRMSTFDDEVESKAAEKAAQQVTSLRAQLERKALDSLSAQINETADAKRRADDLIRENEALKKELLQKMSLPPPVAPMISKFCDIRAFHKSIWEKRLFNALSSPPKILSFTPSMSVLPQSDKTKSQYDVTLEKCTCKDWKRDQPCKHVLYLAYILGMLQINRKLIDPALEKLNSTIVQLKNEEKELSKKLSQVEASCTLEASKISELKAEAQRLNEQNQRIVDLINEKPNAYPRIAALMADFLTLQDAETEISLRTGTRPAPKAADAVAALREEKRELIKKLKVYEYKFSQLLELFPNIEDVFDADFKFDEFELEAKEPSSREIKEYLSRSLNARKYRSLKEN